MPEVGEARKARPELQVLLPFATQTQAKVVEAIQQCGSHRKAAAHLGMHVRNLDACLARLRKYAARHGVDPEADAVHRVAHGQSLRGVSTLYKADGSVALQWVKSKEDQDQQLEIIREAVKAVTDDIKPLKPRGELQKQTNDELLNLYVLTDYHIGARSWPEETGGDAWDTEIAEALLTRWFDAAIRNSPNAKTAILAQLGDFLDHDGLTPVTPTSGNVMDSDSRYQKIARVAIRVLRSIIEMLLKKHEFVHVLMAEGNHDITSSVWLREIFYALYEDEPRVTVDRSPDVYYCYEHGATSLFFHHGHKRKPADIDSVFVAKYRDVFGRTKHSYAHMGHLHHVDIKETELMVVEQHRTLASRNAHESRHGWMSGRDAKVVTYHRQHGRVSEQVISPAMVE